MWLKVLPRIVEPHQALGQSASQVAPAKRYYIWLVVAQPGLLSFSLGDLKEGKIYAAAMVKRKFETATAVLVSLDEEIIPIAIVVPKYLCPTHIRLRQPQGFLLTSGCSMSGQFVRWNIRGNGKQSRAGGDKSGWEGLFDLYKADQAKEPRQCYIHSFDFLPGRSPPG
ncbi:hypothetical protein DFH08DRAFT_813065 [Mycena albidolilacea]|uniref:Uncharacterized protein n=1 Tax=Mycena albidolilacea TaxID=1033008 RepID=A0AAD6ZSA0_9AGAR|nr:hypothetical protein DFH08DRAFT_813065 [Mycena albidolilacea]